MKPLRDSKLVSAKDISDIFSNCEMLLNIHQQFVLKFNTVSTLDSLMFGQIFVKVAAFLKIYNTYCADQTKSFAALHRLRSQSDFEAWIKVS